MRLVDADALKEYCINASKSDDDFRRVSLATLASVIDAQTTSYDVDKVVEQLRKDKFIDCETVLSDVHQGYNAGLSRAIDIVKAGGKNDD